MTVDHSKADEWRAMQARNGRSGGGSGATGGSGGPGAPSNSFDAKDYVDAKIEVIDSKLVTVETRLLAKLDALPDKGTLWGAVATGTAIILAVAAFAGDRFDAGLGLSDTRLSQLQRDEKQDNDLKAINQKLDKILQSPNGLRSK